MKNIKKRKKKKKKKDMKNKTKNHPKQAKQEQQEKQEKQENIKILSLNPFSTHVHRFLEEGHLERKSENLDRAALISFFLLF